MNLIEFKNVSKTFVRDGKQFLALDAIDLQLAEREFVAIVGPSGCGKTTALRMVAGFEDVSQGSLTVNGKVVEGPGPDRAVVFQQFALFPWKNVEDNIEFGLKNRSAPPQERREAVDRYIALMGLKGYETAFPHQLSGGMQQRVAIARAYALESKVLLMDEPFGALDAQTRVVMQEELVRLARSNPRTVLFITHAVEEAVYLADRVVIMTKRPGRIKEIIDVRSVRERENWDSHAQIEEVMELESFNSIRTHIWSSLRQEKEAAHA